ncbi:ATP-dependent helicase, partial [Streptomyces sp. ASQP_92]|nr:ATP-dependent helicase [Streptomyces sp. ASQP_92]
SARIVPQTTQVSSGDEELTRITGAQTPSGIPVTIAAPVAERPRRSASASSRGRRGRPGQRSGRPARATESRQAGTAAA